MANYSIEIKHNNVTPAQFLWYVRQQYEKKSIYVEIEQKTFRKPLPKDSYSCSVIDGEKDCYSTEYRTVTKIRRKLTSHQTSY